MRRIAAALALASAFTMMFSGVASALETSSVVTVPGSVASVTVEAPVALSPATIHALASAIASASAARRETATVSVVGTLPVSVQSIGSFDSGALDSLQVAGALAFGAAFALCLGGLERSWKR